MSKDDTINIINNCNIDKKVDFNNFSLSYIK